ncbi:polyprenyl synthetase family protein [Streptomyces sp. H39-S7]|uniref:polyprenyl synthetase family protein n=1 Tax=Streptomyces sp. H39-S7 TaxID=3004357 RepID=UPI0022AFA250|nr:polyprenyl synthetase family protein [Streptomyces sp. H39-S7]MCZ4125420.1 polyprenyl synthetase family protein [Streptomyces sp. H39-S7]
MALKAMYEVPLPGRLRRAALVRRLALDDSGLEARLRDGLEAAEKQLLADADSAQDPRIAGLTGHLTTAGGKRLRPLLVLLGAEFGDPWRHGVIQAAVIAELVHVSSLYHDDVMDNAATRHGVSSANARWGERLAVLAGDLLLAKAAQLAAELGPEAVALNADVAGALVAGQLSELVGPGRGEDAISHYFRVISGKTAALLAMALRTGAQQAGAPAPVVRALGEYGEELGLAFQIADDLLDLKAPTEQMGKEQGADLAAGVASLPVLLALADPTPRGATLRELLSAGPTAGPAERRRALKLFRRSPALAEAEAMMHQRLDRARQALADLPPGPALRALNALCDFVASQTG